MSMALPARVRANYLAIQASCRGKTPRESIFGLFKTSQIYLKIEKNAF